MAADWDSEEFNILPKKVVDKWAGEDDDDDENIRDNWDDEDDIDQDDIKHKNSEVEAKAIQTKKKKSFKERLAEKEEKLRKEMEELAAIKKQELENKKALTPKQIQEEKMRKKRMQEEADLNLALEAFGLSSTSEPSGGEIDNSNPNTKEEFELLSQLLTNKISKYRASPIFSTFVESLLRDLILPLESKDLKTLSASITTLYNEKLKEQKASKQQKKKVSKKFEGDDVILGGRNTLNEYSDYI